MTKVEILNPNREVTASHKQMYMKTISRTAEPFESTYALIMRSEEKQRSRFEILVYVLLIASTTFAVSEFGRQAAVMPSRTARISTVATVPVPHGV
jgi:hypothetical protein